MSKMKSELTENLLKQTSEAIQVATETVIKSERLYSISGYTIDQLIDLFLVRR